MNEPFPVNISSATTGCDVLESPTPVGQDISVQKAVLVHTVGMSKSELGRFYLRFSKKLIC